MLTTYAGTIKYSTSADLARCGCVLVYQLSRLFGQVDLILMHWARRCNAFGYLNRLVHARPSHIDVHILRCVQIT